MNDQGFPMGHLSKDDLAGILKTLDDGHTVDPAVIRQLVADVQFERDQVREMTIYQSALIKLEEIALEHWQLEVKDEKPQTKGFEFIRYVLVDFSREYGQMRVVRDAIEKAEEEVRVRGDGSPAERIRQVVRQAIWKKERAEEAYRHMGQDMLVWVRALGLTASAAANGGTHREKDARMRGMIEMIESAVQAIRNALEDGKDYFGYRVPDVFRSDYPVREYKQKIHELERELERVKGKPSENGDDFGF